MAEEKQSPRHVAIIMDGNGRWGLKRKKRRTAGHIKGAENVKLIVRHAGEIGLQKLTLWGFSTDNWKRPGWEVNVLMKLFVRYGIREADEIDASNVRVRCIGRREGLPPQLQRVIEQIETRTHANTGLYLQVALNYGGLQEIVDATNNLLKKGAPITDTTLNEEIFGDELPPDLIIRTSGEQRTSGFMPLASHAEWAFTNTLWPDFTTEEFDRICEEYTHRERRFGGLVTKPLASSTTP